MADACILRLLRSHQRHRLHRTGRNQGRPGSRRHQPGRCTAGDRGPYHLAAERATDPVATTRAWYRAAFPPGRRCCSRHPGPDQGQRPAHPSHARHLVCARSGRYPQAARTAHDKLQAYANDPSRPAPTAADYLAVGLVQPNADRTPLVSADNLGAINTALASASVTGDKASDPALLKGIIDAYQHVIDWKLRPTCAAACASVACVRSMDGIAMPTASIRSSLSAKLRVLAASTHSAAIFPSLARRYSTPTRRSTA